MLEARELQRRAVRGVSWSMISSVASMPVAIAVSVTLARVLGPDRLAHFAYLTFVVPLLPVVLDLGFEQATVRQVSRAYAEGRLDDARELLGKACGWNLLRLVLLCPLALLLVRPGLAAGVALVALLAVTHAGAAARTAIAAENRMSALAKQVVPQLLVGSGAAVAVAVAGGSAASVFVASLAGAAIGVPFSWWLGNPELRRAAFVPRLPTRLPPGFRRYGLVGLGASLGYLLVFSRSEVVILDLLHRQHALAVFALAYGLSSRLTTPVDTLLGPLIPALAALDAGHPERMRAAFERSLRLSSAAVAFIGGAAGVGTVFLAPVLFGPEYRGVGLAFAALAAASLVQSAAHPYTAFAYATGRPGVTARALAIALVVDVAVAFATIPFLGLWGAVLANSIATLTAVAIGARAAVGRGSVRRAGVPALRLAAAVGCSCAAAYALGLAAGSLAPIAGAAAAFLGGTIAFALVARLLGGLAPARDLEALAESLPGGLSRLATPLVRAYASASS